MKRTKEWWARLTEEERILLVALEDGEEHSGGGGGWYPDDCGECGYCSSPSFGGGLCNPCSKTLDRLLAKANGEVIAETERLPCKQERVGESSVIGG